MGHGRIFALHFGWAKKQMARSEITLPLGSPQSMPLRRLDYLVGAGISLAPSEANPQHESYSIRRNHGSKESNGNLAVYCSIRSRCRRCARIAEGQGQKAGCDYSS